MSRVTLGAQAVEKCGKIWQRAAACAAPERSNCGARRADGGCAAIAALHACSACAGDYEDPDRTAWTANVADGDEREDAPEATEEEFPAKED
jgi:hypothetical protein